MQIKLKEFQINTVNKLLDATSVGLKKEILLTAPTGSGKTIILLSFIEEYFKEESKTLFVWLTPGKGDLEEQSMNKMKSLLPSIDTLNIQDVLLTGFKEKSVSFINWETITKKGNTALKEAERKNLYERINEAKNNGLRFIVIVDEEHLNKTVKAESIINYMNPDYIIRASATTKKNEEAENIVVKELDVISSGLITKALYINENLSNSTVLSNEHEYLVDLALNKRNEIKNEYINNKIQVNPMIIIQVPSKSDELISFIEEYLKEKNFSYEIGNLAIWLADRKENIEDISNNESPVAILIMKQAISTGWDCPRAKILVKLRDNMNEDFETQTIGRIRRMPQGHHYDKTLLDNCYLYTLDQKYEEAVKQELGSSSSNVKVVFLKNEFKDFKLTKLIIDKQENSFDERETFNLIYNYVKNKYNLKTSTKENRIILESNGYNFSENIENTVAQGKVVELKDINDVDKIKLESKVDTHKNGIELRHAIGEISTKIGLRYDRTRVILDKMFFAPNGYYGMFVKLKRTEYYAFIINNLSLLKKDFEEAVTESSRQTQMDFKNEKEVIWKFPERDFVKYDANTRDQGILEKEVYIDYPSSNKLGSRVERLFQATLEASADIKWFHKNGESSEDYFSVVYKNALGKRYHFYPDFIVCDIKNRIWIIETKGGEDIDGNDKNIDIKADIKFDALKEYSKKYNINFAFVRDYEKNNHLYYSNTIYVDDLDNEEVWISINNLFE